MCLLIYYKGKYCTESCESVKIDQDFLVCKRVLPREFSSCLEKDEEKNKECRNHESRDRWHRHLTILIHERHDRWHLHLTILIHKRRDR